MLGLADGDDPDRIAVIVAVVGQEIRQSERDRLVLDPGERIGSRIGDLGHGQDVDYHVAGLGRDSALEVGAMIADRDRAVEVLRPVQRQALALGVDRDRKSRAGAGREALVHNDVREDRVGRLALGRLDVDPHRDCADIDALGRHAAEGDGLRIEGQPVRKLRLVLLERARLPAIRRKRKIAVRGEEGVAREECIHLRRHADRRIDHDLERDGPVRARPSGGDGLGRREGDLHPRGIGVRGRQHVGHHEDTALGVEVEPVWQRAPAGASGRDGGARHGQERKIGIEGDPRRQRRRILRGDRQRACPARSALLEADFNLDGLSRIHHGLRHLAFEGERVRIEGEPVGQPPAACERGGDGDACRERVGGELQAEVHGGTIRPVAVDHAGDPGALIEDHVAIGLDVVAEDLARDEHDGLVLETEGHVVEEHRHVVAGHDLDRDEGPVGAASAVGDLIGEARCPVVVRAGREGDEAVRAKLDLAVEREPLHCAQDERIPVRIGVVGEEIGRVDHDRLVLEGRVAAVIARRGRIVERDHVQRHGGGRARAAGIDEVVVEAGGPELIRREADLARRLIEDERAVGDRVDALEEDLVALEVHVVRPEVGEVEHVDLVEPDRRPVDPAARRVVHGVEVELDRCRGRKTVRVAQRVGEAREAVVVRHGIEGHELAVDPRPAPGRVAPADLVERLAFGTHERAERDDAEAVAVDVAVVREEVRDADPQDLVLVSVEHSIIGAHGRVVDGREVHLDPRGRLPSMRVAHRVLEERVTVEILRPEEAHRAVRVERGHRAAEPADLHDLEVLDAFRGVVLQKVGRLDRRPLVLDAEAVDVVGRVEPPEARERVHRVPVPDGAVGEDDLLDAGAAAEELAGHAQRVDQEGVVALELEEHVVAFADDREVLRRDARAEEHTVGARHVRLGENVRAAVEAEAIAVRARAARGRIVAPTAIEHIVPRSAAQDVAVDRAPQLLEPRERVPRRLACEAHARAEIDLDAFVSLRVVGHVIARAAEQRVRAASAADHVVACVAGDGVVVVGAANDLNAGEGVAGGVPTTRRRAAHVDRDALDRERIVGDVDARAADQRVGPAPADQDVVALAAVEHVVAAPARKTVPARVADEPVREVGTREVLDRNQHVAFGIAARRRAVRQRNVDRTRFGQEVVGGVRTLAAVEPVRTGAAVEHIVARAAFEGVVAAAPFEHVRSAHALEKVRAAIAAQTVGPPRAGQIFDAGVLVALRGAALAKAAFEVRPHTRVRAREHHAVAARAAVDVIGTLAAVDHVVALAREDQVIARPPEDGVVAVPREDVVVALAAFEGLTERVADQEVAHVRADLRAVVVGRDADLGRALVREFAVRDEVVEPEIAREADRRLHHDELTAIDGGRSGGHAVHAGEEEDLVVDVGVVGEKFRDADHHRHAERALAKVVLTRDRLVVHRNDGDVDIALVGALGVVGDGIIEARRLVGVEVRGEDDVAVLVELERAVEPREHVGRPDRHDPQGIAVDVGVVGEEKLDRDDERLVLVECDFVVRRHRWRGADILEEHGDRGVVHRAFGVEHRIVEPRLAPEERIGREDHREPVGAQSDLAALGIARRAEGDPGAVDVAVVLHQLSDRDYQRHVLGAEEVGPAGTVVVIVPRLGIVVDRRDLDLDPSRGLTALPVVDAIGETRRAGEVRRRGEEHGGVLQKLGRAALRLEDTHHPERVAFGVSVVGEEEVGADDDRVVLERREGVRRRLGRVVHRRDVEAHPCGVGSPRAVRDDVVEIGIAKIGRRRGEEDHPVIGQLRRHVRVADHLGDPDHVAVDVGVVPEKIGRQHLERRVFKRAADPFAARIGRVVHGRHPDGDLRLGPPAFRGVGRVEKARGAVEVGLGREIDLAIARQGDGATFGGEDLAHDHAVAVEVVGKEPLRLDREEAVLLDGEALVGQRLGARADTHVHRADRLTAAAVREDVGQLRRAAEALGSHEHHVAVLVQLGEAVRTAVHGDDLDRVAVGVEVVAKEILRRDRQRIGRGGSVVAIVPRDRSEVVEEGRDVRLGPGHAVGEDEGLDAAPVRGERIDDGERVVRGREGQHHGVAAGVETPHRRLAGDEVVEADRVGTVGGGQILDRVGASAAREDVEVVARSAVEDVVAREALDHVVARESRDTVAERGVGIAQHGLTHLGASPDHAVGKLDLCDRVRPFGECVRDHEPVATLGEAQDEVVSIRPEPRREGEVGLEEVRQDDTVLGIPGDPIVAVARAVDVGVRSGPAGDHVAARAAGERIVAPSTDDDVVTLVALVDCKFGKNVGEDKRLARVYDHHGLDRPHAVR